MILALKTSDPVCHVWLDDQEYVWEAGRTLAHGLLEFIEQSLKDASATWTDIAGIVVFRGPGSFTGLRIGITVMNTIAAANGVSIVGETGEQWHEHGRARLLAGDNDQIVLPEYGGEAHITTPRK